ncbi:MAG: hypothetical protein ACT4QE_02315 [Anaerolineales bacterium]
MADEDLLYFNGINGATGDYETMPLPLEKLAQIAKGETLDEQDLKELQQKHAQKTEGHWAVKEGIDPKDLSQTGWGVIFAFSARDKTPAIREALSELLQHRQAQAGPYYKEYIGPAAYRPNEGKNEFLARHGAGPGPADPAKVPYYLLIVGDPEAIPYKVQYQLDVQYAVGRIHFETVEEYAAYARAVVTAETSPPFLPRKATLFGVSNPDDPATSLSAESLIKPLSASLRQDKPDWSVNVIAPADSTKARLGELLGGADMPALLFTASHGMGFPQGDTRQLEHQGALLCQDWPGPQKWRQPIKDDFYFSADDVRSDANLLGLMAFYFACYGAGTPKLDDFAHKTGQRAQIAPHAFVAGLPRKLLARGALAAVGHVERAWGTSFLWDKAGVQLAVFESSFIRLLEGHPVGSAFEFFNERYAEISSDLSSQREEIQFGAEVGNAKIAGLWTANNDARSYVSVGDPAARIPVVGSGAAPAAHPGFGAVTLPKAKLGDQTPAASAASSGRVLADHQSDNQAVDYGIKESLDQVKTKVQDLVNALVDTLKQAVDDITSLEVKTYVSEDLSAVKYNSAAREFAGAQLRAMTRINLDGDTVNVVPESAGELDQALWHVHLTMVEQAQTSRTKMLETAVGLLMSLKSL